MLPMDDLFAAVPSPDNAPNRKQQTGQQTGQQPRQPQRTGRPPLADRIRPQTLEDVVGQSHLLAGGAPLRRMLDRRSMSSVILWGPPGCGKTSIARLIAKAVGAPMISLSAVMSGVADLRKAFEDAKKLGAGGEAPILFIDEIHRYNRAQQDGLLHSVEAGSVALIGATTENPSFTLNAALVSRCHVLVLERLDAGALDSLIRRAEAANEHALPLDDEARAKLIDLADGDGRYLLNMVEQLADLPAEPVLDPAALSALLQRRLPVYDRQQEAHYNLISALHKSVRGSDPDATLYWLCRMLEGGEDPRYIGRRLIRMASEDIGLADPQALPLTIAACESYERLGSPEGELALAQAAIHLATAPKSNAAYVAYKAAVRSAKEHGSLMPPAHILNAPTGLMKDLGYGKGYEYDHDSEEGVSGQDYFPDSMEREKILSPDRSWC